MPRTIIKIKTWACEGCGYRQDFEPTDENMMIHFTLDDAHIASLQSTNKRRLKKALIEKKEFEPLAVEFKENLCPSCHLKGNVGQMVKETNPDKKITMTIQGEEELDLEIEGLDKQKERAKKPKMIKAEKDAHKELRKQEIAEAIIKAKEYEDID